MDFGKSYVAFGRSEGAEKGDRDRNRRYQRVLRSLRDCGIKATAAINAQVMNVYSRVAETGPEAGWSQASDARISARDDMTTAAFFAKHLRDLIPRARLHMLDWRAHLFPIIAKDIFAKSSRIGSPNSAQILIPRQNEQEG